MGVRHGWSECGIAESDGRNRLWRCRVVAVGADRADRPPARMARGSRSVGQPAGEASARGGEVATAREEPLCRKEVASVSAAVAEAKVECEAWPLSQLEV